MPFLVPAGIPVQFRGVVLPYTALILGISRVILYKIQVKKSDSCFLEDIGTRMWLILGVNTVLNALLLMLSVGLSHPMLKILTILKSDTS